MAHAALGLVYVFVNTPVTPPCDLDTLFQPLTNCKPMVSVFDTGYEVRTPKCQ